MSNPHNPAGWILGDSFSTWHKDGWVGRMCEEYNLHSVGRVATNNVEIWRSGISLDPDLPAIINLSHLIRIGSHLRGGDPIMTIPNLKASFKIKKRFKLSYVWTPFPGYEAFDWVDEVHFREHNDLYFGEPSECILHYTPEGHDLMFEYMSKQFEQLLHKKQLHRASN